MKNSDNFFSLPSGKNQRAMQARLNALMALSGLAGGRGQGASDRDPAGDPRHQPVPPALYQFKITLRHLTPAVWRRIQVSSEITLGQLHDVIQIAMGWYNDHLHDFRLEKVGFASRTDPMGGDLDIGDEYDENDYRLGELGLRAKSKFDYRYDFGDDWIHQLVLEKILAPQPDGGPSCLEGARACPAEDSGGPWGYAEKLAVLADSKHRNHSEVAEWLGEGFDPEAFDLAAINRRLASLHRQWSKAPVRKRRR